LRARRRSELLKSFATRLPLRDDPVDGLAGLERPVLPLEPDPSKRVTHLSMRVCKPELHAARQKCLVQVGQEFGASKIDFRNRTEEKDDQPYGIRAGAQQLEQTLADELRIEVQERC